MDPYIENISLNTEQQFYDYLWHFQRKNVIRSLVICALGFVIFLALYFMMDNLICLFAALIYAGLFVWQWMKPRRVAKKIYNEKFAYYNQTIPPLTYRFFDDHFEVSDIDSHNTATYDKAKEVVKLSTCVCLVLADQRGFLISDDGYKKGTLEDLISFLRGKCPQINPAKWQW